ncbi:hypothetical protein HRbin18_02024 [bacterium HR18]|nr:hypothetical protein HRbin18_02024 [bacterium HR18]
MAWSLYRWVWQVESPLHIGMAPAGMLNRTRLYVPARTLWGALTAELARSKATSFPDYKGIGERLKKETRFSYLYPAEEVDGEWKAWLPRYREGKGLVWEREDRAKSEKNRAFRMRLLSTRPGTAIAPESNTAHEGTLREFEVVGPYWRDEMGGRPVALVGYVFVQSGTGAAEDKLQLCGSPVPEVLWCGGDTRYGLGKIRWVACRKVTDFFGCPVECDKADPVVQQSCRILAHVPANSMHMQGEYELLIGWDDNKLQSSAELYWQPGTVSNKPLPWKVLEDGYWEKDQQ